MIDLHERLSEFSYGYGVTREVEKLLSSVGVASVPFLPSLLQEKTVGFDVKFQNGGVPLLLQFKLGQSLQRFVRSDKRFPPPALERPFFRFSVNTAEPDGQFETLLKAEIDGAETYYIAPRFSDWSDYITFFETGDVLERSVMVKPSDIRSALVAKNSPDGPHRIVYDRGSVNVCSAPVVIPDVRPNLMANNLRTRLEAGDVTLGQTVRRIYAGLDERAAIRRTVETQIDDEAGDEQTHAEAADERPPIQETRNQRTRRLEQLRRRARSEIDAVAATLALEFWGLGIQLIFAVKNS